MRSTVRGVIAAVVVMLLASASANAATLYVNASTGNDATTKAANTESTPWRTIGRAAWGSTSRTSPNASQAATAGDTVVIAAGTYNYSGSPISNRFSAVYNPVNQGTGTSPAQQITFLALGTVILTAPTTESPVIGCSGRNHVVWRGRFELNEASIEITPDTGTVVLHNATGCGVDGIYVDGNGFPVWVDNHTGVRVERCTNCFVRNSTITDVKHPSDNHNGSAVMLYDSYNTIIEHNNIFDVNNAIYIKGAALPAAQSGTIVRYNVMSDCYECIAVLASRDSRIYQNVIKDSEIALALIGFEAAANNHPVGDWFVNNTVDNMAAACVFPSGGLFHQNVRIWNNIFTNCDRTMYREGDFPDGSTAIDWEHNDYFAFRVFATDDGGSYSFTQWRSTFVQDADAPASVTTDPRFANAAADDFRLCTAAGAPHANCTGVSGARNLGLDMLDLDGDGLTNDTIPAGAYLTNNEVIGPPASTIPTAPQNLRITTP
jgi:hypothetical protein